MDATRSPIRRFTIAVALALVVLALVAPGAPASLATHKYTVSYSGSTAVTVKVVDTEDVQTRCTGQEVDTSAGSESAKFKTVHIRPDTLFDRFRKPGTANPYVAISSAKADFSVTRTGTLTPLSPEDAPECQLPPNYSTTCRLRSKFGKVSFALRPKGGKETIYNDTVPDFFYDPQQTGSGERPCTTSSSAASCLRRRFRPGSR